MTCVLCRTNVSLFTKGSSCRRVLQEAIRHDSDDKSTFRESAVAVLRMCRSRAPHRTLSLPVMRLTSQV